MNNDFHNWHDSNIEKYLNDEWSFDDLLINCWNAAIEGQKKEKYSTNNNKKCKYADCFHVICSCETKPPKCGEMKE